MAELVRRGPHQLDRWAVVGHVGGCDRCLFLRYFGGSDQDQNNGGIAFAVEQTVYLS